MKRILISTVASVGLLMGVVACGDGGSAEKTGENMDSAIEEATTGEENLGDGPLEQAGESVDNANDEAADAVNDATDGNPNTNP